MGFDRESAQRDFPRFDGYRHWAAHRASDPEPAPGNPAPDDDIQLAIESLRDRILVGSMCATIDEQNSGMFSYGVGIGPRHRRSGYAGDAINTLLAHMFGRLRYHKCEVGIYSCNAASLALHEKLGFRERGRLLDPQFLCGGAQSLVLMTITATEFAAFNPNSALAR